MNKRIVSQLWLVALVGMLCALPTAWADVATTQPTPSPSSLPPVGGPGGMGNKRGLMRLLGGRPPRDNGAPLTHVTAQEWNDVMAFLDQYAPTRAKLLRDLNPPETSPVKLELVRKWRAYKFASEHFPEMAKLQVKAVQDEDQILHWAIYAGQHPDDMDEVRAKVQDGVGDLVQVELDEHRLRIKMLTQLLDQENSNLSRDEADRDQTIERRTQRIMDRIENIESPKHGHGPEQDQDHAATQPSLSQADPSPAADDSPLIDSDN